MAIIRYEKRTKVHTAKLAGVRDLTVQQEVIDDAVAAATAARATAKIDPQRVFVLGHSLGGYLAPRILVGDDRFAGAIVLAGSLANLLQASIFLVAPELWFLSVPIPFGLGLLNGWLRERSRSIWPGVIIHATSNVASALAVLRWGG